MTYRQMTAVADRASPTLTGWLAGTSGRMWRAYLDRRAQRATVRILHSLDARTLRDIGVSRTEIESLVYGRCDRVRGYDRRKHG
jgi:uncharacterized protein YjiS (DUF1127 family)